MSALFAAVVGDELNAASEGLAGAFTDDLEHGLHRLVGGVGPSGRGGDGFGAVDSAVSDLVLLDKGFEFDDSTDVADPCFVPLVRLMGPDPDGLLGVTGLEQWVGIGVDAEVVQRLLERRSAGIGGDEQCPAWLAGFRAVENVDALGQVVSLLDGERRFPCPVGAIEHREIPKRDPSIHPVAEWHNPGEIH